jgi:hypothetical protein
VLCRSVTTCTNHAGKIGGGCGSGRGAGPGPGVVGSRPRPSRPQIAAQRCRHRQGCMWAGHCGPYLVGYAGLVPKHGRVAEGEQGRGQGVLHHESIACSPSQARQAEQQEHRSHEPANHGCDRPRGR